MTKNTPTDDLLKKSLKAIKAADTEKRLAECMRLYRQNALLRTIRTSCQERRYKASFTLLFDFIRNNSQLFGLYPVTLGNHDYVDRNLNDYRQLHLRNHCSIRTKRQLVMDFLRIGNNGSTKEAAIAEMLLEKADRLHVPLIITDRPVDFASCFKDFSHDFHAWLMAGCPAKSIDWKKRISPNGELPKLDRYVWGASPPVSGNIESTLKSYGLLQSIDKIKTPNPVDISLYQSTVIMDGKHIQAYGASALSEKLARAKCLSETVERICLHANIKTNRQDWGGEYMGSGMAGGWIRDEVMLNGAYELIERDALTTCYFNKVHSPRLSLDYVAQLNMPVINKLLNALRRNATELKVFDITNDLGIPTVFCIMTDAKKCIRVGSEEFPLVVAGLKSNINIAKAVAGSLEEMYLEWVLKQNLTGKLEKRIKPERASSGFLNNVRISDYYLSLSCTCNAPPHSPNAGKFPTELGMVNRLLKRKGFEISCQNVTPPYLAVSGYVLLRVLIPGLQPFMLHERKPVINMQRMRQVRNFFKIRES